MLYTVFYEDVINGAFDKRLFLENVRLGDGNNDN